MKLRLATPADSPALLDIYAQYIDTPITFEYTLPTQSEFANRIADTLATYPYLVCEEGGQMLGYAYAHRQREREAYQWNAELSIYLDRTAQSRGLGSRLYGTLLDLLRLQGIKTVYGVVTTPNEKSERLHLGLGFRRLGTFRNTGYKNGRWHDVSWFEKALAPYEPSPDPILPVHQLPPEQVWQLLISDN